MTVLMAGRDERSNPMMALLVGTQIVIVSGGEQDETLQRLVVESTPPIRFYFAVCSGSSVSERGWFGCLWLPITWADGAASKSQKRECCQS